MMSNQPFSTKDEYMYMQFPALPLLVPFWTEVSQGTVVPCI